MAQPALVRLSDHLDLRELGAAAGEWYALLGGYHPSGSIKDVGLRYVLAHALRSGAYAPGTPLAEISTGSMARSVALWAQRAGTEAFVSFPGVEQQQLDRICAPHPARALVVQPAPGGEHPLVAYFAAFEQACRERGYFYPDQTRNPLFCEGYARAAAELRRGQAPLRALDAVIAGVGSGATLLGFKEGLGRAGTPVIAVGVEPAAADAVFPPWDDIPGLRNTRQFHWGRFGRSDCYQPEQVDLRIEVTRARALACSDALRAAGLRASASAGATLAGALAAGPSLLQRRCLLIFADAVLGPACVEPAAVDSRASAVSLPPGGIGIRTAPQPSCTARTPALLAALPPQPAARRVRSRGSPRYRPRPGAPSAPCAH